MSSEYATPTCVQPSVYRALIAPPTADDTAVSTAISPAPLGPPTSVLSMQRYQPPFDHGCWSVWQTPCAALLFASVYSTNLVESPKSERHTSTVSVQRAADGTPSKVLNTRREFPMLPEKPASSAVLVSDWTVTVWNDSRVCFTYKSDPL